MYPVNLMHSLVVVAVLVSFSLPITAQASEVVTVKSDHGMYRGKAFTLEGRPMAAFLGIRYAVSPTRKARWQKPTAIKKFGGVYDATKTRKPCPQYLDDKPSGTFVGRESCLTLDVVIGGGYRENGRMPVLVYINSANNFQNGLSHSGAMLARRENLIVIVIYSRLGVLGYINDGLGTGTMGLWDNLVALQWVNENIAGFGGDPDMVTIMGTESGATIATLLGISPLSDGLFSQIISLSPLSLDTHTPNHKETQRVLRKAAGCGESRVVTCNVASLTAKEVAQSTAKLDNGLDLKSVRADKELFPEFDTERLLEFALMTGSTSGETLQKSVKLLREFGVSGTNQISSSVMQRLVDMICDRGYVDKSARCLCNSIMTEHFEISEDQNYTISDFQKILGGYMRSGYFSNMQSHAQSNESSTFAFYVDLKQDPSVLGISRDMNIGADSSVMIKLAFGYPWLPYGKKFQALNKVYDDQLFNGIEPRKMFGKGVDLRSPSYNLMRYIGNFVRSGDPTDTRAVKSEWPEYGESKTILTFKLKGLETTEELPQAATYDFFNKIFFRSRACRL